jgi:hypothetical protein
MFNNMAEGIIIINAIPLLEPFSNKPSFIPINSTIRFSFDFVNPFAVNYITARRMRD